ncbi:MAG: tRNA (adenosine(37)-N6)-threonylcarbamoyltransferase complex dimerization subunit type 1 TsaB [Bacillota bacterium]|nr:tRNA (adenosine(37)-N6)-threonylcarbamoyltransferase complex dimerization subunit type 1 TsaB [Bacillota bacterium]
MKLLAIDTTGAYSSIAIYDDGIVAQIINQEDYSHLQRLVPTIKQLMDEEEVRPEDLDAIAVSRGPGSFTGIRIGMATAKGLAQIWNKPIVEVPTLATFAYRDYDFGEIGEELKLDEIAYCPVFDAKREQIYGGAYRYNSDEQIIPDSAYDLSEYLEKLLDALKKSELKAVCFFGDGIKVYQEKLDAFAFEHFFAEDEDAYQTAFGVARLGLKLFEEGKTATCYTAQPEYLRAAEAERKLAEKIKADSLKLGTDKENKY